MSDGLTDLRVARIGVLGVVIGAVIGAGSGAGSALLTTKQARDQLAEQRTGQLTDSRRTAYMQLLNSAEAVYQEQPGTSTKAATANDARARRALAAVTIVAGSAVLADARRLLTLAVNGASDTQYNALRDAFAKDARKELGL